MSVAGTQTRFGRFEIRRRLGLGMASVVDLAFDPRRNEEVALKRIPLEGTPDDVLAAERAGASLQDHLSLQAPQVARVYEHDDLEGYFYVVMEYVEGRDLAQILEEADGPLSVERSIAITDQLCEMLEIAHGLKTEVDGRQVDAIIHGDLKPENVRLQEGDRVRILDFGASKVLTASRKLTRNLFGTYPYTPPEQLQTRGLVNEQSDLWAVGIILYKMVAGREPYPGPRPEDLVRQELDGPPAPLPGDCPREMRQILQRCLSRDTDRRYAAASELRADLAALRAGEPLAPWPSHDVAKTHRTVGIPRPESPSPAQEPEREPGRGASDAPGAPGGPPDESTTGGPTPWPPSSRSLLHLLHRLRTMGGWGQVLLVAAITLVPLSQVYVRSTAGRIVRDLASEASPDVSKEWGRYAFASHFTPFGLGLGEAKASLHSAALASAERVLRSYREDVSPPRQGDWLRARDHLQIALRLKPDDPPTRARLLYAQAHVDRIDAVSLGAQGKTKQAVKKRQDAIFRFRRAAELAKDWPDPLLGLARIYAYDQFDLDALSKAVAEAERRGYRLGDREQAQLADGHFTQGKLLYRRALALDDQARKAEMLNAAVFQLKLAGDLYETILHFGQAARNRRAALDLADTVRQRLGDLHSP